MAVCPGVPVSMLAGRSVVRHRSSNLLARIRMVQPLDVTPLT